MSLLFETIRLIDGIPQNMRFHAIRFAASWNDHFGIAGCPVLEKAIQVPAEYSKGIARCRVEYGKQIEEITFSLYVPKVIRSLKLIADDTIEYNYKYTDRERLNLLLEKRQHCDEILIVKNGCITDTSFSNIVFLEGENWVTPQRPLLRGTMREYLLSKHIITEKAVQVTDLAHFSKARLVNAMLPFRSGTDIPIDSISGF